MIRTVFVALLILTATHVCRAAETGSSPSDEDRYIVQLLNVEPGGELFMRFGHIAVVVEDRELQTRDVYNFGTFDFTDPALMFRYARGFLNYWLSVMPEEPMIMFYRMMGRGVTIRTLNLTPEQAANMVRRLKINALPENATYAYRHYIDNCCTRIRDLLDDILGGAVSEKYHRGPTGRTYRYWTRYCLRGMPVMSNIILLILSGEIDKPISRWDEEFLPDVFVEDLDNLTVGPNHVPIIKDKKELFPSRGPKPGDTPIDEILLFVGLYSLLFFGFALPIIFPKKKWAVRFTGLGLTVWGILGGLMGLLLLVLWFFTTHYDTHHNENVLTFVVLHLWLLGPGLKLIFKARIGERTAKVLKWYFIGALGLIALDLLLKIGPFHQNNYRFIAFAAACDLAAFFALRRIGTGIPRLKLDR